MSVLLHHENAGTGYFPIAIQVQEVKPLERSIEGENANCVGD